MTNYDKQKFTKDGEKLLQMHPVNHMENFPKLLHAFKENVRLPLQSNIFKFTTLLYYCPYACYLLLLMSGSLMVNRDISNCRI